MEAIGKLPSQPKHKNLRACLLCSLIQAPIDFRKYGCPNCEDILAMKGAADRVTACTTTSFDGMIAMINPEASWVARWQRIDKYVKGVYAIRVTGKVPEDVLDELEARGINYRPRDSIQD